MASDDSAVALRRFDALRQFQDKFGPEVSDASKQSPALALHTLRQAAQSAPAQYRDYLDEAVACYEGGQYRAAILMVWAATVQHLFDAVEAHKGGIRKIEVANFARSGSAKSYREIKKVTDLLYLPERQFLELAEVAGLYNRNARDVLVESLNLRNRCGHPTGYTPGREEAVVFIERLILNVLNGSMILWT